MKKLQDPGLKSREFVATFPHSLYPTYSELGTVGWTSMLGRDMVLRVVTS